MGEGVMDRLRKLFNTTGRASRLAFWRFQLRQQLAVIAVFYLAIVVTMAGGGWLAAAPLFLLVPIIVAGTCFCVRRLHDRGRSGWWIVAFALGPYLLETAAHVLASQAGALLTVLVALPLVLGALVLAIWGWIETGFRRGTRGPNAFGPEPA
jgi:uncharacterized membrane protein YhaH (DUF805 family)